MDQERARARTMKRQVVVRTEEGVEERDTGGGGKDAQAETADLHSIPSIRTRFSDYRGSRVTQVNFVILAAPRPFRLPVSVDPIRDGYAYRDGARGRGTMVDDQRPRRKPRLRPRRYNLSMPSDLTPASTAPSRRRGVRSAPMP